MTSSRPPQDHSFLNKEYETMENPAQRPVHTSHDWENQLKQYYQTQFQNKHPPSIDELVSQNSLNSSDDFVSSPWRSPILIRSILIGALLLICALGPLFINPFKSSDALKQKQIQSTAASFVSSSNHTQSKHHHQNKDLRSQEIEDSDVEEDLGLTMYSFIPTHLTYLNSSLPSDVWWVDVDSSELTSEYEAEELDEEERFEVSYLSMTTDSLLFL